MEYLNLSELVAIISALAMVLSVMVALSALLDKGRKKSEAYTELRMDIKHIRENVDMTNIIVKSLDEKLDCVDTRLTRVEEGTKSAHKRIDILAKSNGKEGIYGVCNTGFSVDNRRRHC